MKRSMQILLVVAGLTAAGVLPARAQVPQIQYRAVDALSDFPDDIHLGEAAGVARNSDGEIFVYTRTGNPSIVTGASRYVSHGGARIFKFDSDGEFEREIGQETYGALYAQQVRVDPDDLLGPPPAMVDVELEVERDSSGRCGLLGRPVSSPTTAGAC